MELKDTFNGINPNYIIPMGKCLSCWKPRLLGVNPNNQTREALSWRPVNSCYSWGPACSKHVIGMVSVYINSSVLIELCKKKSCGTGFLNMGYFCCYRNTLIMGWSTLSMAHSPTIFELITSTILEHSKCYLSLGFQKSCLSWSLKIIFSMFPGLYPVCLEKLDLERKLEAELGPGLKIWLRYTNY